MIQVSMISCIPCLQNSRVSSGDPRVTDISSMPCFIDWYRELSEDWSSQKPENASSSWRALATWDADGPSVAMFCWQLRVELGVSLALEDEEVWDVSEVVEVASLLVGLGEDVVESDEGLALHASLPLSLPESVFPMLPGAGKTSGVNQSGALPSGTAIWPEKSTITGVSSSPTVKLNGNASPKEIGGKLSFWSSGTCCFTIETVSSGFAGLVAATISPSPVGVVGAGIVAEIGLKEAAPWSEPESESGPESPPPELGSEPASELGSESELGSGSEPEPESESGSEPELEDGPGATAFSLELEAGSEVTAGVDVAEAVVGSVTGIASCSVEELSGAASEDRSGVI